jgi:murein DD-endopeptidase MepM/ murein hydrolase activator NlpD
MGYTVKSGDRVADIAFVHGTTIAAIIELNNLSNADLIRPGQVILLPSAVWHCPVPGARLINDWGYPRSGGRFHQGTDMFADRGTPVYAPVAGVVKQVLGSIGGLQFTLTGDDGHTYFGTHMDTFGEEGLVSAGRCWVRSETPAMLGAPNPISTSRYTPMVSRR